MAEIEKTFTTILSKWHEQEIVVLFGDDQLMALGYHNISGTLQQTPVVYSTESGHPVQRKPDSQSTGKRTPSPLISDTSVGA